MLPWHSWIMAQHRRAALILEFMYLYCFPYEIFIALY